MSFKKASQYMYDGDYDRALEEYKKITSNDFMYDQAQFNISFIENELNIDSEKLAISNKDFDDIKEVSSTKNMYVEPLVSVVMPVYNVGLYLDASILSVINQTYQNIELIVVNDASSDNGLEIIRMHQALDNRIKCINLDFNTLGGAGIPSNIGMRFAKGKYIAFADSDDLLIQDAIENFVSIAEANKAQVVVADFSNFNNESRKVESSYDKDRWNGIPLKTSFNPNQNPQIFRLSPVPWRKFYLRSFMLENAIEFPEGDYFYEDNPLHWFVLASASNVVLMDKVVAYHRMEREGQTMGADFHKLCAQFCHLNSIRVFLNQKGIKSDNLWRELSDFAYRANWIVDAQETEELKNLAKKRYAQTAKLINKDAGFSNTQITDIRPHYIKRLSDYDKSYPSLKLAIVVPIYNCVDLFPRLMRKLLSVKDCEIFLVDDGSDDGSTALCEAYALSYDHIFAFSQKNKGAGVARNSVIPLITAEYTYFLDADDDIEIDNLAKALEFASNNNHDLVFFKYDLHFYEQNNRRSMWESDQKVWDELIRANINDERKVEAARLTNYPWIRIIKTQLLHDELIFFGKTVVHNDVPFHWHSIIAACNIGVFDEVVCIHRKFEEREQITNINDSRRLAVLEAHRYTNELLKKYPDFPLVFNSWQKFVRDLINWAKARIPEAYLEDYKKRQKAIIEEFEKQKTA